LCFEYHRCGAASGHGHGLISVANAAYKTVTYTEDGVDVALSNASTRKTGCVSLCSQAIARAAITPPQAESAVSAVPQAMSTATMEGCHSRITVQLVSS